MTIPTLEWAEFPSVGGSGAFNTWAGGTVDADDMVNDLVDLLVPFWKPDTTFDNYTIYTKADAEATPLPVALRSLGTDGTSIQTAWSKAVQTTFSIRTDQFNQMKIVMLDAPSGNLFDKVLSFDASIEANAIVAELNNGAKGWSGRDGGRPTTLTQIAYTLNESLRRRYRMN